MTSRLPWLLAAGMLVLYLATLNPGVAAGNLRQVVELSGWHWRPNVFAPVTFLVTYPLRWLPASAIAVAANLFAAVCAALTLALLARSVTLLPGRSRFSSQVLRSAWVPPVLAVLACGLQLTFWENSIQAAGEMVDLLLFACAVGCLLEFRIGRKGSWLAWFAVAYGLCLANYLAAIGFLPFFLVALLWTKPFHTLNRPFLVRALRLGWKAAAPVITADARLCLRMALCGLAGLSLLLLPPLIGSFSHDRHIEFWPGLREALRAYKLILFGFPKGVVLLLSLTSVLPVVFMGLPRQDSSSRLRDTSPRRQVIRGALHLIYGAFLIAGIWVALDCPVSPRHQGRGFAFLPLYYLGALSIGYFSGYFLLVFGTGMGATRTRGPVTRLIDSLVTGGIGLLLIVVPALMVCRNLPQIRPRGGDPWRGYFALVEQCLPPQGAVLVSDDRFLLWYFRAAASRAGRQFCQLPLDTTALGEAAYLESLDRQFPQFKLASAVSNRFSDCAKVPARIRLLETLGQSHPLYYLDPSFDYCFEAFYPRAHGLLYELKPYGTNVAAAPLPSREEVAANQLFWRAAAADQLPPILRALRQSPARPNPIQRLLASLDPQREPDQPARLVGACYSRALNHWGVELQERGAYQEAAECFSQARDLNPVNVAAGINQARLFLHTGNSSNALAAVDSVVQAQPGDNDALFLKAAALLQLKAYDEAIARFTYLLSLHTNNYAARFNRAVAYLQLGQLDAAQRDFEQVAQAVPWTYQPWFGLAEIAYRRKDAPAAIGYYQRYLTNSPPDTEEARLVISRLKELQLNQR